jgi:hypothetical protein
MRALAKLLAAAVAVALVAPAALASNVAYDNASSYAYNPGWLNGSNGGFGYAPWVLFVGGAGGHFIWTSTGNSLPDDGVTGGLAGDFDIDTSVGPSPDIPPWPPANQTDARSWAMWNAGGVTDAVRPFTGGVLAIGQSLQVDFDNGNVPNGATVGVGLQNAAGQNLWEVYFVGGGATYINNDAAGPVPTVVPWGNEGLHVDFTLTGPVSYTMTLTRRDGIFQTINGSLIMPVNMDQGVAQFRAFNAGLAGGDENNFYVNSLAIIPDPPSIALVVRGLLGVGAFLRRRPV